MSSGERYEVVWPLARTNPDAVAVPEGLTSLDGKRIGFVWDYVFLGDEMFALLEQELSARCPSATFVPYEVFGNVHGQDEAKVLAALPDKLRAERVDAVVVGVGA